MRTSLRTASHHFRDLAARWQIFISNIVCQLQTVKIPHPIADFPTNVFFFFKNLYTFSMLIGSVDPDSESGSGGNECGFPTLPITVVNNIEVKTKFFIAYQYLLFFVHLWPNYRLELACAFVQPAGRATRRHFAAVTFTTMGEAPSLMLRSAHCSFWLDWTCLR